MRVARRAATGEVTDWADSAHPERGSCWDGWRISSSSTCAVPAREARRTPHHQRSAAPAGKHPLGGLQWESLRGFLEAQGIAPIVPAIGTRAGSDERSGTRAGAELHFSSSASTTTSRPSNFDGAERGEAPASAAYHPFFEALRSERRRPPSPCNARAAPARLAARACEQDLRISWGSRPPRAGSSSSHRRLFLRAASFP
jgi:hypothetical protein